MARPMATDDLLGQELGAYTIQSRLGQGAMGCVYRAVQTETGEVVALKVIRRIPGVGQDLVTRFQREKEVMRQLVHPNVLPIHDYACNSDYLWIAMHLVEAGPLEDRMARARLTLPEVAQILSQTAAALDFAHAQGVIHRDIKPSNVLIEADGHVYLADFGVAKLLEQEGLTLPGATVGTPEYMSPEQVKNGAVTARSDQYSLAILGYQMACGKVPFEGMLMQILTQHAKAEPVSPRKLNPELSDAASRTLLKALAKNPAERFESASEFANAFAGAVQPAGGAARGRGGAGRWLALLVALACFVAGGLAWRHFHRKPAESPTPSATFEASLKASQTAETSASY